MSTEIERKFLVNPTKLPEVSSFEEIEQWYLVNTPELTVRVRIFDNEDVEVTLKGAKTGISCPEFNFASFTEDIGALRRLLEPYPSLKKFRRYQPYKSHLWEIDFFKDGTVIGEVELESEDEEIDLPPWIIEEVSEDPRYFNCNMVKT